MPYQGRQPGVGVRNRFIFTATSGQTSFSGADSNGLTLKYPDATYTDVFLNGALLIPVTDYAATTKTSVVLSSGAAASDVLEVVAYDIASIANTVPTSGGTFTGPLTVEGTVTADGLTVDTDTLYVDSTNDRVGVGTTSPSGTLTVRDAPAKIHLTNDSDTGTAEVTFRTTAGSNRGFMAYDFANNDMLFRTGGSGTAMFINSSGDLSVGQGSSDHDFYSAKLNISDTGSQLASFTRYASTQNGPSVYFAKSRSGTVGVNTLVQDGDDLGFLQFTGADGSSYQPGAQVAAEVDGTPGSADMPGRLVFKTTADGASSSTERMRITSAGLIGLNSTSPTQEVSVGGNIDLQSVNGTNSIMRRIAWRNTNSSGYEVSNIQGYTGGNIYEGQIAFQTKDSGGTMNEAMRIDFSQRLLKGYTSNVPTAGHNAALQVVGAGTADFHDATVSIVGFSANSNGSYLNFGSGRSNTAGTYTIVANDDTVGQINFSAADNTDMASRAAHITAHIDGAPGSNDTPGRLALYTSSDGASNPTERMRIDSTGRTFVGNLGYIGSATTNSVFEAHGGSVVFGSGDGSNQQGYRTFVKFHQVNNSSGLPTSANLDLMGMTSEFYCKITVVGVNPYSGSNAFTYINESTGYAGGNFSVISANEYGAGSGISFGTATLFNPSGTDYRVRIPVSSSYTGYRFIVTAEIIGISNQNNPRFVYS